MLSILALALNRNSATRRMKQRNFLRKKKRRQKKIRGERRVEKGRLCDGLRVYPMIGNSASEKPENLILPFAGGTTRDSFPDQRTARLSRMVGWLAVIQRPPRKTSKQYCHRAKTRKDFNFWSFRETLKRKENKRASEKKEERERERIRVEKKNILLSLANSSFISFLPPFFARWFFFLLLFFLLFLLWCIQRSFQSLEKWFEGNYCRASSTGVDNENYAEDGWYNRNSFPLCEHRPFLSAKVRISPPFRDIAPENIRQTARILFCLAAIRVTCRANAWVGWLIDSNGDDENMCLEYLNVWGEWWSSEGMMWMFIF